MHTDQGSVYIEEFLLGSLLRKCSLVPRLSPRANEKSKSGEPGNIYHVRNVIGRGNLITCGRTNELSHAVQIEYSCDKIAASVEDALRHDEHVTPLVDTLRRCRTRALDLLTEAATAPPDPRKPLEPPKPPGPEPPATPKQDERGVKTGRKTVAAAEIGLVFTEIENAVSKTGATRVEIEWRVYSGDTDRTRSS